MVFEYYADKKSQTTKKDEDNVINMISNSIPLIGNEIDLKNDTYISNTFISQTGDW